MFEIGDLVLINYPGPSQIGYKDKDGFKPHLGMIIGDMWRDCYHVYDIEDRFYYREINKTLLTKYEDDTAGSKI